MEAALYLAGAVALAATLLVVTRTDAVHALLYFIVSLFAVAVMFLLLGAPFVAALEVIVYAGAIMVLFVFVIMLLGVGPEAKRQERSWLPPGAWLGPGLLTAVLGLLLVWILVQGEVTEPAGQLVIGPREVGVTLWGPYVLGVEIAALLLLAGLVGAFNLAARERRRPPGREPDAP
jgi:NADH-quinone oxidoreductase subunit J